MDQLQQQAKQTTNAAVAEGQYDVEAAKATGAGYLDQAKSLASSAITTAQVIRTASLGMFSMFIAHLVLSPCECWWDRGYEDHRKPNIVGQYCRYRRFFTIWR